MAASQFNLDPPLARSRGRIVATPVLLDDLDGKKDLVVPETIPL